MCWDTSRVKRVSVSVPKHTLETWVLENRYPYYSLLYLETVSTTPAPYQLRL